MQHKSHPAAVIVRPSQLQPIYGVSRASAYRWMAEGNFPALIQLSPRCVGWRKADLDAHFGIEE